MSSKKDDNRIYSTGNYKQYSYNNYNEFIYIYITGAHCLLCTTHADIVNQYNTIKKLSLVGRIFNNKEKMRKRKSIK